jgi:hypothetical protein
LSFWEAEHTCENWGGNLASVHSMEENDAIFNRILESGMTAPFYMGLNTHGLD